MDETVLETLPSEYFRDTWEQYDWDSAEAELLDLQIRLTKATFARDTERIEKLQRRIVNSLAARMIAVRKVCSSTHSTGVDGVRWVSSEDKCRAAFSLNPPHYRTKPYRHIIIETKNGRTRPVNIPTFFDRAMQVLFYYSLSPVAEASGDRKSFGFRLGRSMFDANEYIIELLQGKDAPQYVLLTDVKACYASISHEWLLKNIPMSKRVLKAFLYAGYVFNGELFPSEDYGISIGSALSPTIANMTLDGIQKLVYSHLYGDGEICYDNGNMIRFADDLLFTVRDEETAHKITDCLKPFLAERGLQLSIEKTRVVDVEEGFDFLSWHYVRKNGVVIVTPAEKAIRRFEESVEDLIYNHKRSQRDLIDKLNQKIKGFASYHKVVDAQFVFRKMDVFIKSCLLKFCEIKHPKWSKEKIIENFWYRDYNGQYVYALKDRPEICVQNLSDTLLTRHKKVKTNVNPYLEREYIEARTDEREIQNATGKYHSIWNRQGGKCFYCGKRILADQRKKITCDKLSYSNRLSNLVYIHETCGETSAEYLEIDSLPQTERDLVELINSLDFGDEKRNTKYGRLHAYLRKCVEPFVTLSFSEIEKILGEPLCKTAYRRNTFWYAVGETSGRISQAWILNGYELQHVDMSRKKIVLHRISNDFVPVKIPEVFLSGRVPQNAKFELENFCAHIKEKYGL